MTELFYPISLKTELKFLEKSYEGYVTNLNKDIVYVSDDNKRKRRAQRCALCGVEENLKLYRINPPKIEENKNPRGGTYNRKVITLCVSCHRSTCGAQRS